MNKHLVFYFVFLCSISGISQNVSPKAEAKEVITTFFEGFHKGDTLLMRSVLSEDLVLETVFTDPEGNPKRTTSSAEALLAAIANRPAEQQWEERIAAYNIQVDGNLAHVWTPYEFWLNGSFSHCGANAFTLIRTASGWKILHLIDSRRRKDCKP